MPDESVDVAFTDPPGRPEAPSKVKSFIAAANASKGLILAVAALVAALAGWFKPQDHSVTKVSYEEMATGIEKLGQASVQNHDDIIALQGYLAGLAQHEASEVIALPTDSLQGIGHGAGRGAGRGIRPTAAPAKSAAPALPIIHARIPVWKAPDFTAITKAAESDEAKKQLDTTTAAAASSSVPLTDAGK